MSARPQLTIADVEEDEADTLEAMYDLVEVALINQLRLLRSQNRGALMVCNKQING